MFSFRKIMIVMLAALILGGGMISMSMHAMAAQQHAINRQHQQRQSELRKKQFFTCFGMSVLLFMTTYAATSALMHAAYTKMLLNEQSPQRLNKLYGEYSVTAFLAGVAAVGGTIAYYFAKFRDQENNR